MPIMRAKQPLLTHRSLLLSVAAMAIAMLVAATVAVAHDTWLLPQSLRVPVGRPVLLSLTSGMAFPADDFAIKPARVTRATVRLAGERTNLARPRSTTLSLRYEWTPRTSGIAGLAVELAPKTLTLARDKIEEYFTEINASRELRATWDSMPLPRRWRESYTKHTASFVRVGNPRSDSSWREPLGMGFEIVPEVDPTELHVGQTFPVRVERGGRPVARLPVGLQNEGDAHVSFSTTDASGRARMELTHGGRWLLSVTDLRRSHAHGIEWVSDFATLTIAVLK